MTLRWALSALAISAVLVAAATTPALGADVFVSANANISTLVTSDDTVLVWTGNYTVTVDATTAKTLAGLNAGGFNAVVDFGAADRKVLMGNSAGNVVIQTGGGDISVTGAGTGAMTAGFLVPGNISGETVDIRANIDDGDNANHWIIGNNTLRFSTTTGQVGTVNIGSDGGIAKIDADQNATIGTVTPAGDFTIDVASSTSLTITNALNVGANIVSVVGTATSSNIVATGGINLDNGSSVLSADGTLTIDDVNVSASAGITLLDGAKLTLNDAVAIGANTLTVTGTTGGSAETLTASGGLTLNNAASQLNTTGDTTHTLIISKVDVAGADLTSGKIDVDQDTQITTLTASQDTAFDIASGKTLSGTVNANTAAKTMNLTNFGTVSTLNGTAAGVVVDVDESGTITSLNATENTTVDVAVGKTLTTTATVSANKVLTANGTGTLSTVTLNGASAELNMTAAGTVSTLNVNVDGGILDADSNCTVTHCVMKAGAGNLTVENAATTITSSQGFDVNDNEFLITQAGGVLDLAVLDTNGGDLNIDENTTVTAVTVSSDGAIDVANTKTLTTTATVSSGHKLASSGTGTISAVTLNGTSAELNMTASGTVTTATVSSDGGIIDVDQNAAITNLNMTADAGDTTIEVAAGKTLTGTVDVNNNSLTLSDTGVPGAIIMDTDGGRLDVNADSTPASVTVTGDVTIDVAETKQLSTPVSIGSQDVTLLGEGTISRIDASTGSLTTNNQITINDLRIVFGVGTFTYGGSTSSTVKVLSNSTPSTGARFLKTGAGKLVIEDGFNSMFSKASSMKLDIDGGAVILGAAGSNDNITFNDDGDEITVAGGAELGTYGSFTVSSPGTNVNLDAAEGSVVHLASADGAESLTASADNDFSLLGTVAISGTNGDYALNGAFDFKFGDIEIGDGNSLINQSAGSSMLFLPGSTISLDEGATLTIDGIASSTRIAMTTTTGSGSFTIDRGGSDNVTLAHVTLSRAVYTSDDLGAALDELDFDDVVDSGGNTNVFSPADVPDDIEEPDDTGDTGDEQDEPTDEIEMHTGSVATVTSSGRATAAAASEKTGALATAQVRNAVSGSLFITLADGNLRDSFVGIEDERALPVTMRINASITGEFTAVVELCYTPDLLQEAGVDETDLILYTFDESQETWVPAGNTDQYRGDREPTETLGDHGIDTAAGCLWVVRDEFSDFAAGVGSTDVAPEDQGTDGGGNTPTQPTGLCGIFGMIPLGLTIVGLMGIRQRSPRRR